MIWFKVLYTRAGVGSMKDECLFAELQNNLLEKNTRVSELSAYKEEKSK